MSDQLPNTDELPTPSKAKARVEGVQRELESRAETLREARVEAEEEVQHAEDRVSEIDQELENRIQELREERDAKVADLEQRREAAEQARDEADRMNAILAFAKGEISLFQLALETLF